MTLRKETSILTTWPVALHGNLQVLEFTCENVLVNLTVVTNSANAMKIIR